MKRKLVVTAIAVIVSIPLIPVIEKDVNHLTGGDSPMVFAAAGWRLEEQRANLRADIPQLEQSSSEQELEIRKQLKLIHPGETAFILPEAPTNIAIDLTASPSIEGASRGLGEGEQIWIMIRPGADGWSILQPHFQASYTWSHSIDDPDSVAAGFSEAPFTLNVFAGGANQHTSWRPAITALSPMAAIAGGRSFNLTVNGSDFDTRSMASWGESGSSAPIVVRWKGSNTISDALPSAAAVNYLAQYQANSLPTLTGTALASGLNIGLNTSGGITNWLSPEQRPPFPEDLKTPCTTAKQWCAMFITDGEVLSNFPRPGIDSAMYQTLIVEMRGDPGSAQLDNGKEIKVTSTISSNRTASNFAKDSFARQSPAEASKNTNKYKFVDETQLPATGLYYLRARYYNPSGGRFISPDAILTPTPAADNVCDSQDTLARLLNLQSQRVAKSGWYALQVGEDSAHKGLVELEFVPDNNTGNRFFTLTDSGNGGQEAGLVHIEEPGSVIIRASGREQPALRGMDDAEFMSRWRESTFQRGFLTVTFLNDILPLMAYILVVCLIRAVAYWLIGKVPRAVRKRATEEVDLMLAFAKWAGVACYTIWTAKDILAGVGIVFAK